MTQAQTPTETRIAEVLAFLMPILLIVVLGLENGGFGVEARHIAGIGTWLVVILLLATGRAGRIVVMKPAIWSIGLIVALAALSLVSSFWSGSAERSFTEAGRVLVYLGFFIVALLLTQTETLRQRFAEGIAVAIVLIALLGLGSRLLPELIHVSDPTSDGPRLRFPLGYWNANGALVGIGVALLLWLRQNADFRLARSLAPAFLPVLLLTLYFTYSRGGLLAGLVATGCLIAFSKDRLRHIVVLSLALIATAPALLAVQDRRELADGIVGSAATSQGTTVLLILIAGCLALLGAIWAVGRLSRRHSGLAERLLEVSRNPTVLRAAAGLAVAAAAIVVIAVGGRAWDQFSHPDLYFPEKPEEHFAQLSGAGRHEFWRVAIESYEENPVLGTGAGTYELTWRREREIDVPVRDAHSVYLEAFSELGTVGGLLVIAMIFGLIGIGFSAWSRDLRRSRERSAVLLAAMIAFAVAAGFDWFWEMPAVGAIFFLSAGVLISTRCSQLESTSPVRARRRENGRYAAAIGVLALGWITIAILGGPLIMKFELRRSQEAAAAGNMVSAVDHALNARSLQPWAASPYIQLGGLAELEGAHSTALEHYHQAANRDSDNWQVWFLGARAAAAAGDSELAERYLERASELNPLAHELQEQQP